MTSAVRYAVRNNNFAPAAVLSVLADGRPRHVTVIVAAVRARQADVSSESIRVALGRLVRAGVLSRESPGVYRQVERPGVRSYAPRREHTADAVLAALPPGVALHRSAIVAAVRRLRRRVQPHVVYNALTRLVRGGLVVRPARGMYARGAP